MAEKLNLDTDMHDLKFGKSFDNNSHVAFHSMRYDFKPESLDSTRTSTVNIGGSNSVEVTVPHIQSSGTSHTTYKGNKRPVQKECVLIIDHDTGEFTLEKLSNAIQLKKTRVEGSSKMSRPDPVNTKVNRPHTPSEQKKKEKTSPKSNSSTKSHSEHKAPPPPPPIHHSKKELERASSPIGLSSQSSDSSSESDSDSDSSNSPSAQSNSQPQNQPNNTSDRFSNLSHDLMLSDSGSDSD